MTNCPKNLGHCPKNFKKFGQASDQSYQGFEACLSKLSIYYTDKVRVVSIVGLTYTYIYTFGAQDSWTFWTQEGQSIGRVSVKGVQRIEKTLDSAWTLSKKFGHKTIKVGEMVSMGRALDLTGYTFYGCVFY